MATLRELRDAVVLTQEQAAERAQCSTSIISKLERGEVPNPSLRILESLATVYECPLADVVAALRETVAAEVGA